MGFPFNGNVKNVTASVPRVRECHALMNARIGKLKSKGFLVSLPVILFGQFSFQYARFDCFDRLHHDLSEGVPRLVAVERHW